MLRFLTNDQLAAFLERIFPEKNFRLRFLRAGLLNQNMIASAGRKKFLLKVYRPEFTPRSIAETHRAMVHAARRGVPVPCPSLGHGQGSLPVAEPRARFLPYLGDGRIFIFG